MLRYDKDTKTISIIAKDTGDLTLSLSNYLLADGDKVYFTVNKDLEKENPLISIEVNSFPNGTVMFHLTSQNTDIAPGSYLYDVQVNSADGRVDTILGPAKFKVIGGVKF